MLITHQFQIWEMILKGSSQRTFRFYFVYFPENVLYFIMSMLISEWLSDMDTKRFQGILRNTSGLPRNTMKLCPCNLQQHPNQVSWGERIIVVMGLIRWAELTPIFILMGI